MSIKQDLAAWIKKIGREDAGKRLVLAGIHIDTAVKLLNGAYPSKPKMEMENLIRGAINGR